MTGVIWHRRLLQINIAYSRRTPTPRLPEIVPFVRDSGFTVIENRNLTHNWTWPILYWNCYALFSTIGVIVETTTAYPSYRVAYFHLNDNLGVISRPRTILQDRQTYECIRFFYAAFSQRSPNIVFYVLYISPSNMRSHGVHSNRFVIVSRRKRESGQPRYRKRQHIW